MFNILIHEIPSAIQMGRYYFLLTSMKFQIAEFNTNGIDPLKSLKLDNKQLSTFLSGIYFLSKYLIRGAFNLFMLNVSLFSLFALSLMKYKYWGYILKYVIIFSVTENYEPVYVKWTTERCAICRWVEDWEENKIIICNRYLLDLTYFVLTYIFKIKTIFTVWSSWDCEYVFLYTTTGSRFILLHYFSSPFQN